MNELEFRIGADLKDIIGKDLITDDFIAVFELVKNSYDAHASNVQLNFEDDKLTIFDNGKGMSLDDIKDKWLFVAYSAKKNHEEDKEFENSQDDFREKVKSKRYFAGAKGIGRFSCDRLGAHLKLTTKKIGSSSIEELHINWKDFEDKPKVEFVEIKVSHRTILHHPLLDSTSGTILEISGLRSSWPRAKLQELKYSLEKLINPFKFLDAVEDDSDEDNGYEIDKKNIKDDFAINVICKREEKADEKEPFKRDKLNGPVTNFIFETLNVKTTRIETKITGEFIYTTLIDRGTKIYKIKEPKINYEFLESINFTLFFLNRAAKINFSRLMGIQPIHFGSVFLFKNGFRVYPFGDSGDDSLGIDYRHQQRFRARLGSRELLGRIELFTDRLDEFKEVSSRDGGLVETMGYQQLKDAFYEKCLKRLEKYVVDIQWAKKLDISLEEDKDKEDISIIRKSLAARRQFADVLRKLTDNKEVEIITYNKDLLNIINEKVENLGPDIFNDLTKIAQKAGDKDFIKEIESAESRYRRLLKDKEAAERRAEEEEEKRRLAEERARKAEEAQRIEEESRRKAEEAKRKAELEAKEKEIQRREEELKRKEAEQKAQEAAKAKVDVEKTLKVVQDKNTYLNATRKTLSEDAEELIHSIKVSVIGIDASLESLINKISAGLKDDSTLLKEISQIKFITEKVLKLSLLITKSNFKADQEVTIVNVVEYLKEYISTYSFAYEKKINIEFQSNSHFATMLSILDLSIVIDNLISNSFKAGADKILIEANSLGDNLEVLIHDNGVGVVKDFVNSPDYMFELGAKTGGEGSGIGLYSVKRKMEEMDGEIKFLGNGVKYKGASFQLIFNK